jgi:hypothetical protein
MQNNKVEEEEEVRSGKIMRAREWLRSVKSSSQG